MSKNRMAQTKMLFLNNCEKTGPKLTKDFFKLGTQESKKIMGNNVTDYLTVLIPYS